MSDSATASSAVVPTDEELWSAARSRYLTDAAFHAAVDTAVQVKVPDMQPKALRGAFVEVATQAAAFAIVLHEHTSGSGRSHQETET